MDISFPRCLLLMVAGIFLLTVYTLGQENEATANVDADEETLTANASSTVLLPGQIGIPATKRILSPNGAVELKFSGLGNLIVVKTCDDSTIWKEMINGGGKRIIMARNGNLEVRDDHSTLTWSSDTAGNPGAGLILQNDGLLCVLYEGRCIWSNDKQVDTVCRTYISHSVPTPTEMRNARTVLESGQELEYSQTSQNGSVGLRKVAVDQEIVSVYRICDGFLIWSPRTYQRSAKVVFVMQPDGNLVLYGLGSYRKGERNAFWSSGPPNKSGSVLKLFDDGLLCVAKDETCVWSSERRLYSTDCTVDRIENSVIPPVDEANTVSRSGQKL